VVQAANVLGNHVRAAALAEAALGRTVPGDVWLRNLLLNEWEMAKGKTVLESKVRALTVTLSNQCNLSCIMCITRHNSWRLPEQRLRELVDLFAYLEKISWQGGEVFTLPEFPDLLREAARYPALRQNIVTNGQCIREDLLELLVRSNLQMTFSIDGVTRETYEYIRRGGDFARLLRTLDRLAEEKRKHRSDMVMNMNVVVMKANAREIERIPEFAARHGFEFVCLLPLHSHVAHEQDIATADRETRECLRSGLRSFEERAREYGIRVENRVVIPDGKDCPPAAMPPPAPTPEPAAKPAQRREASRASGHCFIPWRHLLLDYDGTVRPDCLCPEERNAGSLSTLSIADAWNSPALQEYRRAVRQGAEKGLCSPHCIEGRIDKDHLQGI
jgi:MoaA/NifB/PqqE/SkfB family radical SAM enzyme